VIDFIELDGSAPMMYLVVSDVYDKTIVLHRVEKEFKLLDVELAKDIETHNKKYMCVSAGSILYANRIARSACVKIPNFRAIDNIESVFARRVRNEQANDLGATPIDTSSDCDVKV